LERGQFSPGHPGRLVRITSPAEGWAYVPALLPPEMRWDEELLGLLSAADRAVGRLAGAGATLPNPHLLIGPFRRREAILSSRIEGTQADASDLVLFEVEPRSSSRHPDALEVHNYVRALDLGLKELQSLPLCLRLIRRLHATLMEGVRGGSMDPGEFRRVQNWIAPAGHGLESATFVPPPPEAAKASLEDLERFMNTSSSLPALVRLAMIHYQFESIHPFLDGNGRVGRLLITLQLCAEGVLPQPLLYLSAFFEQHRQDYYDHLMGVSTHGAWEKWIGFFLRGVASVALDAVDRADRLLRLRHEFHARVHAARASALLLKLCDHLFENPAITTKSARALLDITPRAVQNNVDRLVDAGVLTEVTGRRRGRVWIAQEIIRAIED